MKRKMSTKASSCLRQPWLHAWSEFNLHPAHSVVYWDKVSLGWLFLLGSFKPTAKLRGKKSKSQLENLKKWLTSKQVLVHPNSPWPLCCAKRKIRINHIISSIMLLKNNRQPTRHWKPRCQSKFPWIKMGIYQTFHSLPRFMQKAKEIEP